MAGAAIEASSGRGKKRVRALLVIAGIVLAAVGGVVVYHAAFVSPPAAFIVNGTSGSVHEVHNLWRIAGGIVLFCLGATLAFLAARRRS
jgi:type IV secretory pathway protease TraF